MDSQISISPMFIAGCPSQNPERPFFHLLCLCRGFIEPRLKIRASMLPAMLMASFPLSATTINFDGL